MAQPHDASAGVARRDPPPLLHDWAYEDPAQSRPATVRSGRARATSAALAAVAAATVVGALLLIADRGLYLWPLGRGQVVWIAYGSLPVMAVVSQIVTGARQTTVLAVMAALLVPAILGLSGLLVVGYAAVVIALAQPRRFLGWRVAAALLVWAGLPIACWTILPRALSSGPLRPVIVVWASLAYAAIYVLVEQRRAAPGRFRFWDHLFYFTALPRLVMPFFQPISPSLVKGTNVPMDLRLFGRTIALGLYGAGLLLVAALSRSAPRWHEPTLQFARAFLAYYAAAAGHIFVAMAAFRSLGIDLPSGFRWPFLSRSFAEFFRSWNHYVRDAILSLFYFPLVGRLRRHLPKRAVEIVAPYLAIFIGAFVMNDALVPIVTSPAPLPALARAANPVHMAVLLAYWSAIILPRQLWRRRHPLPVSGWRRWLSTAIFLALYVAIWRLAWGAHGR